MAHEKIRKGEGAEERKRLLKILRMNTLVEKKKKFKKMGKTTNTTKTLLSSAQHFIERCRAVQAF